MHHRKAYIKTDQNIGIYRWASRDRLAFITGAPHGVECKCAELVLTCKLHVNYVDARLDRRDKRSGVIRRMRSLVLSLGYAGSEIGYCSTGREIGFLFDLS